MVIYNYYHLGYDTEENGGKADYYNGEHDDEDYGKLYIPRIEAEEAHLSTVKKIFMLNKIGMVTSASFTAIAPTAAYKSKNKRQLYSAYVYVKWFTNELADAFRQHILIGDKANARLTVNEKNGSFWIIRPNTACPSVKLLEERFTIAELAEIATDVAVNCLEEDAEEELILFDLEQMSRSVALALF